MCYSESIRDFDELILCNEAQDKYRMFYARPT